jgi:hypothetical protein
MRTNLMPPRLPFLSTGWHQQQLHVNLLQSAVRNSIATRLPSYWSSILIPSIMALSSIDGRLLVQVILLCGLPFLLWSIPRVKTGVPLVIMQMAVGILVGPSVLGILIPEFEDWVFHVRRPRCPPVFLPRCANSI